MTTPDTTLTNVAKRPPSEVMRLARLGAMHQCRLSFMRVLLRRLQRDQWRIARTRWEFDEHGVGVAVYTASGPERCYSLIAFGNDLDPSKRSDRVIAEEWDATFTLFDGVPTTADIERLARHVPLQEAGRISATELSLSRANRSVRLFDYVRRCLADGLQPQKEELDRVGYLMRTTAVYGSGKFGACDRQMIADRVEFTEPFQTELLSVLMIRTFSTDMVEHLAAVDNPQRAVPLEKSLKRRLGIGNSTGLGMAPFLINHPTLFSRWIQARETALARIRSQRLATDAEVDCFLDRLRRQMLLVAEWHTDHAAQQSKIIKLGQDLARLDKHTAAINWHQSPWQALYLWSEKHLSTEAQECLVSLLMEPYPQLVDALSASMSVDESDFFAIDGRMSIERLRAVLEQNYAFAGEFEAQNPHHTARFWYTSEEKLEPRLGERFEEAGAEREHPLAVARDIHALRKAVVETTASTVAEFVLAHPQHRHSVRRAQQSIAHPYAEVADNVISADMLPVDLLRCKLSFFGAVKFDPRSDRWLRINMYQHAPLIEDFDEDDVTDDWIYPPLRNGA